MGFEGGLLGRRSPALPATRWRVTRDGEPGQLYSSFDDNADASRFLDRGQGDRHQFRLIVSSAD